MPIIIPMPYYVYERKFNYGEKTINNRRFLWEEKIKGHIGWFADDPQVREIKAFSLSTLFKLAQKAATYY